MPLSRLQLSHVITRAIEADILQGRVRPGDRLPSESEFCKRFSASRTVIRESLQQLKARGMLKTYRGSGSYVTAPDRSQIRKSLSLYTARTLNSRSFMELMDLRILIETDCARRVARQKSTDALAAIRARLVSMETNADDLLRFGEADIEFHLEIVRNADNSMYTDILGALLPELGIRFAHETYVEISLVSKNLSDHKAIFSDLAAGNARNAAATMHSHLSDSREHMARMFSVQTSIL